MVMVMVMVVHFTLTIVVLIDYVRKGGRPPSYEDITDIEDLVELGKTNGV